MDTATEQPRADNIKVLIIDDDVRLQSGIHDFLGAYQYEVISLYTGANIQKELAELEPDIVLLDVMLPGEDGFVVLQQLRKVSRIPVIMLTALGSETDRIIGLEMEQTTTYQSLLTHENCSPALRPFLGVHHKP